MQQSVIPRERYSRKVASEFASKSLAERTVQTLIEESGFERAQVAVVEPDDPALSRKVEPETRAIGARVAIIHLAWVTMGFLVGLAAAWLLVNLGPALTQSSPRLTYLALLLVCTMTGFALGTVQSLQPGHDHLVNKTRSAMESGHWTVVVHCADDDEKDRAKRAMDYSAQTL